MQQQLKFHFIFFILTKCINSMDDFHLLALEVYTLLFAPMPTRNECAIAYTPHSLVHFNIHKHSTAHVSPLFR